MIIRTVPTKRKATVKKTSSRIIIQNGQSEIRLELDVLSTIGTGSAQGLFSMEIIRSHLLVRINVFYEGDTACQGDREAA